MLRLLAALTAQGEGGRRPQLQWSALVVRRKLLVWLLSPLVLLIVVDAVASYYVAQHFASVAYDRILAERARELMLKVKEGSDGPRLRMSDSDTRILLADPEDRLFYRVVRPGEVLAEEQALLLPDGMNPLRNKPLFFDTEVDGVPVRAAALREEYEGSAGKEALILVAETLNKRSRLFQESLAGVVMPQVVVMILAGSFVWFGVTRSLAPLRRLEQVIASRSHLDLSPVLLEGVPGRVQPLVEEINALMARLSEVLEFQNRFISDAAHQMRTPVAGLKAQIEIVLRETDPERLRHSMSQIYVGMSQLSRLVAQLLSLARNEPNAVRNLKLLPMDLNRLVLETTMDWVPEALKKGIDLGFDGGEAPVIIKGDPDRLRELINNLFDNAIRYTPAHGRVTATVTAEPRPTLSINDDGPAIPVEERRRVFERFHRLLGTNTEGSGLGLAIVNEIAKIHGAEVDLMEDVDGVGNTFLVSFPGPEEMFS